MIIFTCSEMLHCNWDQVLLSLSKDAEYLPKDADDPSNDDVLFPAVLEPFSRTLKYTVGGYFALFVMLSILTLND